MEYVYILKSINFLKTYVDHTTNLTQRLKQHNFGYSKFTKRFKPWKIIYSETCENSIDARKKEKYLKSSSGGRWIKKTIFSKI